MKRYKGQQLEQTSIIPRQVAGAHTKGRHSSKKDFKGAHSQESSKKRRNNKKLLILVVVCVVIALIGAGFLSFHLYSKQKAYKDAKAQLNTGIECIAATDETVVSFDNAIDEQVSPDALASLQLLLDQVPQAQEQLKEAIAYFDEAAPVLEHYDEREVLQQACVSAEERMQMLNLAAQLVSYDMSAMESAIAFSAAWTDIIAADAKAREAAALVSRASETSVTQARDLNKEALQLLDTALGKLNEAQAAFPQADFSVLFSFVQAEQKAIGFALVSDEAYLSNDFETSTAQTEAFNVADKEAIAIAATLPSDPTTIILDAYNAQTTELRDRYVEARRKAAAADTVIRDSLGIGEAIIDEAISSSTQEATEPTTETSADESVQ